MQPIDIFQPTADIDPLAQAEPTAQHDVRIVLTVEEAAQRLGVGRSLMYALVTSGAVESIRIGRLRRIPTDALTTFVASLRGVA